MSADRFLLGRHSAEVLSDEQLAAVLRAAGCDRTGRPTRIVGGYDNAVYRVGTTRGAVFVRAPLAGGVEQFAAELQAMALAARAVPVPEVLWSDQDGVTTAGRPVAVLAQAPGHPVDAGQRSTSDLESLGETLAALHRVPMPGYWRPDNGRWMDDPRRMSELWVQERYDDLAALADADVGLTAAELDAITAMLEEVPTAYGDDPAVLLHGDLGPRHVFVAEHQVSCLIDWGEWSGGPPISEFATLTRKWDAPAQDAIRHGYGIDPGDEEFDHRVAVLSVGWIVGHLQHFWRVADQRSVAADLAGLRHLVSH